MDPKPIRLVLYTLFGLWAGFWLWFSFAAMFGGEPGGIMHLVTPVLPIVVAGGFLARKPVLGGFVLLALGMGWAVLYRGPWAWGLMSGPAALIGLGFVLVSLVKPAEPS